MKKTIKNMYIYNRARKLIGNQKYKSLYAAILEVKNKLEKANVEFIFVLPPMAHKINTLSEFERERINSWIFDFNNISDEDTVKLSRVYGDEISLDYIKQVYDGAIIIKKGQAKYVADFNSTFVNVINGMRVTSFQPLKYNHKINIYGACTIRGTGVEDNHTIASFLQKEINRKYTNKFRVENHGIGCGSTIEDDLSRINLTTFRKGDIVILCHQIDDSFISFARKRGIKLYDSSIIFSRKKSGKEWFTDNTLHTNKYGNELIAKYIFTELESDNIVKKQSNSKEEHVLYGAILKDNNEIEQLDGFKEYLAGLKKLRADDYKKLKIGSIVMNCNPFTLGHRYLIERSSNKVDFLYIFIVEEDKSYFKFADRYQLVKEGTQDLANVLVVPSGKFIISALTFEGYFYKDNLKDTVIDTSKDVDLFGKYIAPTLNIKIRFAGEEPLDPITRQYNETMNERLPLYGIEFSVIPRKTSGSEVISASQVRKYLEKRDFESMHKLLPESTYHFLVKNYKDRNDENSQ